MGRSPVLPCPKSTRPHTSPKWGDVGAGRGDTNLKRRGVAFAERRVQRLVVAIKNIFDTLFEVFDMVARHAVAWRSGVEFTHELVQLGAYHRADV